MPAPIKLTSDDVGAPALSGEDAKLYDVLKWALPLLGWTIAFDDAVNFRIVFRNDSLTGTGSYLRIIDKAADHGGTAAYAQINAYETMSDIDTGTRMTPATAASYVAKSSAVSAVTRKWTIWGDKRGFILSSWLHTDVDNGRVTAIWCMDLVTIDPLDSVFLLRAGVNAGTAPYTSHPISPSLLTSSGMHLVRSRDGLSGPQAAGYMGLAPTGGSSAPIPGVNGVAIDPEVGTARFDRNWVHDGTQRRGYIPGCFQPLGNWTLTYGQFVDVPDCNTPDGIRSLHHIYVNRLTNSANNGMGMLIDETDGWAGA